MSTEFRKKLFEAVITLFIGLIATILAVVLIFLIRNFFEPPKGPQKQLEDIKENTQQIKEALTPYETKNKMNKAVIIENFSNSTSGNSPAATFDKQILVTGHFNDGYLYVKASINNSPLDGNGTIYAKLKSLSNGDYKELGGHLIASKSLEVPKGRDYTELLFSLSDIKYKTDFQDSDYESLSGDWLKLLNRLGEHSIISFTSSTGDGKIIELSIYYECSKGENCNVKINE